jgi:transcriptional regulator with XRE-family HTH domain
MNTFSQVSRRPTAIRCAIAELTRTILPPAIRSDPQQVVAAVAVATADPFERMATALADQQVSLAGADGPASTRPGKQAANAASFFETQQPATMAADLPAEDDDALDVLLSSRDQHDDCERAPLEEKARLRAGTGRRLFIARELAGLSQTDAAKLFGYQTPAQLSMWELGRRSIPMEKLVKAAQVYAVSADFLLCLSDDPERDTSLALRNSTLRGVRSMLCDAARLTVDAVDRHAKLLGPDATRVASLVASGQALVEAVQAFVRSNHETFDDLSGGARLQRCAAEFEVEACVTRTRLNAYRTLDLELRAQIADGKAGSPD